MKSYLFVFLSITCYILILLVSPFGPIIGWMASSRFSFVSKIGEWLAMPVLFIIAAGMYFQEECGKMNKL